MDIIAKIVANFNNREISIFFWFIVFLIWSLSQKSIRESMVNLIKSFVNILALYFLMLVYISIIIIIFYQFQIWDFSLLKDTIYWSLGVAFILLLNINDTSKDSGYFRKVFFNCFKVVILLEFLTNLYSFSLITELFSLPIILLFAMASAFGEIKEEHKSAKKVSDFLISIYGITVVVFSIYHAIIDFDKLTTTNNLRSILLSPTMTILYIPFVYFTALYMAYESFFKSKRHILADNNKLFRTIMWQVFKRCNFNLKKIQLVSRKIHIYRTEEKSAILKDLNIILGK